MVINILNLDKLLKKLGKLEGIDMTPPVRTATRMVQSRAKELAPFDSGLLIGSIYAKTLKRAGKAGSPFAYGIVGTSVEYAIYQEFGTRYMPAHPFLMPAVAQLKTVIFQLMSIYVKEQLKAQSIK